MCRRWYHWYINKHFAVANCLSLDFFACMWDCIFLKVISSKSSSMKKVFFNILLNHKLYFVINFWLLFLFYFPLLFTICIKIEKWMGILNLWNKFLNYNINNCSTLQEYKYYKIRPRTISLLISKSDFNLWYNTKIMCVDRERCPIRVGWRLKMVPFKK